MHLYLYDRFKSDHDLCNGANYGKRFVARPLIDRKGKTVKKLNFLHCFENNEENYFYSRFLYVYSRFFFSASKKIN
jgi:hypothetical protein